MNAEWPLWTSAVSGPSFNAMSKTGQAPDRSAIMRAVKGRDTGPERLVRRLAHAIRPGYRLNRPDLIGKPDIAWIGAKKAVFVHGCFWHGHDCPRGARMPKTNRDYWTAKIGRNVARDAANRAALEAAGWDVLIIWECDLKDVTAVTETLAAFLERDDVRSGPAAHTS